MPGTDDGRFYIGAGGLAAILLGIALVPLRGLTSASNLAFAFMALTIVVAELGGRAAALVTALTSALSLDFFLTQPYLHLSMEDKHDVIGFLGLAACGSIAAALASQRERRLAALAVVERHRELFHSLLSERAAAAPLEAQLSHVPDRLARLFPISAAVVRDAGERVLARAHGFEGLPIPGQVLKLDADAALPREGGRIELTAAEGTAGWLDVWGNGKPMCGESRRALADVACLLALRLVAGRRDATVLQR